MHTSLSRITLWRMLPTSSTGSWKRNGVSSPIVTWRGICKEYYGSFSLTFRHNQKTSIPYKHIGGKRPENSMGICSGRQPRASWMGTHRPKILYMIYICIYQYIFIYIYIYLYIYIHSISLPMFLCLKGWYLTRKVHGNAVIQDLAVEFFRSLNSHSDCSRSTRNDANTTRGIEKRCFLIRARNCD